MKKLGKIDKMFLWFLLIIPFIPSPTLVKQFYFIIPSFLVVFFSTYYLYVLLKKNNSLSFNASVHESRFIAAGDALLVFLMAIPIAVSFTMALLRPSIGGFIVVGSRLLGYLVLLSYSSWMLRRDMPLTYPAKYYFWGFILISALTIFISVTGINLFGELRPARLMGRDFPFNKTCGVPRSYGEFSMMAVMALTFLLVFGKRFRLLIRIFCYILLFGAIFASQSRNLYLATTLTLSCFWGLRFRFLRYFYAPLLLSIILLPFILFSAMPAIESSYLSRYFLASKLDVGTVDAREAVDKAAIFYFVDNPYELITGVNRSEFKEYNFSRYGLEVAIHNHFLSSLVFGGLFGGGAHLALLFIPLFSLARKMKKFDDSGVAFAIISSVGVISSLHFYEGVFSIIQYIHLALLWSVFKRYCFSPPLPFLKNQRSVRNNIARWQLSAKDRHTPPVDISLARQVKVRNIS